MSKPKAGALGVETVATSRTLNGRNHHIGRPDGVVSQAGYRPCRADDTGHALYPGFRCGAKAHASPWAYTYAPFRGSVRIILDTSESTPPLLRLGILCSSNRPCKDPAPYDDE